MTQYDIIGLGNALLDLTIAVQESFLESIDLVKGTMTLVDEERYTRILTKIRELPSEKSSGGSSSNTIKGVSILGGKGAFMGMIGHDSYGKKYEDELNGFNVKTFLSKTNKNTGTAITFITSDGERTFATYLGASIEFAYKNIEEDAIKNSKIIHIEGFFLEPPQHRKAALQAMTIAKNNGVKISVDLSDPHLINRNKEFFKEVLQNYVDIVFVNEHEAKAFTGCEEEDAVNILSEYCDVSIVKLGSKGSIIKHHDRVTNTQTVHNVPIQKVKVVNTNGAGDSYAAGIIYCIANDIPMQKAGKIASYISSRVVSIPEATLSHSIADEVKKIVDE